MEFDDSPICPRCECCEMLWHECDYCGGSGYSHHDCGEDTCVCLYPEDNVVCDVCRGAGGWWECTCDEHGKHQEAIEISKEVV